MKKLMESIRTFNSDREWEQFHTPKNLVMGLSIESAELMEHFLWLTADQSLNISEAELQGIRDEIGDVLIYLITLSDKLGIDLIDAASEKLRKNEKKYPVEKAKGRATKYSDL